MRPTLRLLMRLARSSANLVPVKTSPDWSLAAFDGLRVLQMVADTPAHSVWLQYLSSPSNTCRRNDLAHDRGLYQQRCELVPAMPALISVDDFHGVLLIAAVLSSIIYGVTWLQVYSYYNSHCSRDRWPLKSFVAFLMLVDTANLVFVIYTTYQLIVTNFGVYLPTEYAPWGQASVVTDFLFAIHMPVRFLRGFTEQNPTEKGVAFMRTGSIVSSRLAFSIPASSNQFGESLRSSMPQAGHLIFSRLLLGLGLGFAHSLMHTRGPGPLEGFFVATLSVKVLCDVLITVGMVYTLLTNRTRVRRTNSVLNLLAIYAVNCGTLHLAFAITSVILVPFAFTRVELSNIDPPE
ncbi:hypothetical protein EDB86DRAFT_2828165 [Lactarius hatsudake]|nr:hypothetical protein EDB86DRAFT_2828165 [Lactarius hatsudake]